MKLQKRMGMLLLSAFLFVGQGCSIQAGADLPTGKEEPETEAAADSGTGRQEAGQGIQGTEEPAKGLRGDRAGGQDAGAKEQGSGGQDAGAGMQGAGGQDAGAGMQGAGGQDAGAGMQGAGGQDVGAGEQRPGVQDAGAGVPESGAQGTGSGAQKKGKQDTGAGVREPDVQTVTVTAVGDCTLGVTQTHGYAGSFHEYYDNNGEDYFFGGVRELFEEDDFTLINLECVLSESNDRVEKTWNLKGKPEYVGIMSNSSVEACSLGNNHTLDYGESSLEDTKHALDEAGILYGLNEHVAVYTAESGIVVGVVSSNLLWQDDRHVAYVKDGIEELREQGADLVIACCHWGIEGDHNANGSQRELAHQIIDWGADLVVGTHPHVLQGVELYNGRVICYSLGNFCFGGNRNPAVKDTAVFRQTFTFVDGVLQPDVDADMIPYSISSITSRNDFRPTRAEGERKQQIIADLNDYSAAWGVRFNGEGQLENAAE